MDPVPTKPELEQAFAARHGAALQQRLSQSTVAVCGLGGLGSNISIALARAGIGRLILIDFDRVDITNLHRQQYTVRQIGQYKTQAMADNLRQISPYLDLVTHTVRLTEESIPALLGQAHVICEAFDRPEAKAMLTNTVLERLPNAFLVAASGMAGIGSGNSIHTRKVTSRFYLCGDETTDVTAAGSLFASRVMLCAAHQAHMVLRILAQMPEP